MDTRRTVLALVFAASIFLLWESWMRASRPPVVEPAASSQQTVPAGQASVATTGSKAVPTATQSIAPAAAPAKQAGNIVGQMPVASSERVVLQNANFSLEVDTLGARLVKATLLDQPSTNYSGGKVLLFDQSAGSRYEAQTGLIGQTSAGKAFPNHTLQFVRQPLAGGQDPNRVAVLVAESGGLKLIKKIELSASGHQIKLTHTIVNTGADTVSPSLYLQFLRSDSPPPGESSFYHTFTGPAMFTDQAKFQKIDWSDIEKNKTSHVRQASDGWLGIVQHYFVSAFVLDNNQPREFFTRKVDQNLFAAGMIQSVASVAPGGQQTHEATLYVGPQIQRTLEQLAPGLELVVDYSWLTFIAKPIYWLLEQINRFVSNWGWSIVVLTIIIKALFYPLSAASYKSMAKMKAVAPRIAAIRDRYPNDRAKLNQAMMEIYKTEKINPLGGCLPVVIQIPVFLALYWVLLGSVEMRNAPWILWIQDLAQPDPFYILPLIMAATMFLQTKLNPPPPDPMQAKVMMIMPLVFSVFFFFFPAGLVLYWLVNNVVSIAQQWFIMKRVNAAA
jgi:YidC/Oxa1 family membrane protein insertase